MPFSKKTLEFLLRNKIENSKEYYNSHKDEYLNSVKTPFIEFIERVKPYLREIDPKVEPTAKAEKYLSRIYRDTRFSKDKSLYRDVMWCVFAENKSLPECPAFFLEISPEGFRYGCGWYWMPTLLIRAMRELILENDKSFKAADKAINSSGFLLEGEEYKKSTFPEKAENERKWLNKKCVCALKNSADSELLFSEDFADYIGREFLKLKDVYDFFLEIGKKCLENAANKRQNFDF